MPSHAPLVCMAALRESKCVGGGIAVSGWFVLIVVAGKSACLLPLGDRRFWREKARARLHMQGKVRLLHVISSSHARLVNHFTRLMRYT